MFDHPHRNFAYGREELIIGAEVPASDPEAHYKLLSDLLQPMQGDVDPEELLAGWLWEVGDVVVVHYFGSRQERVKQAFRWALRRWCGTRPIAMKREDDWEGKL